MNEKGGYFWTYVVIDFKDKKYIKYMFSLISKIKKYVKDNMSKDKMISKIKDQISTKSRKISKIKNLKDHHDIGRICTHIHAHKRIVEYNIDAKY